MLNETVSYSELRENLKDHLDQVCDTHAPLLVKRRSGADVVIIAREDYEAMDETAYLNRSPANARRLKAALKESPKKRIRYKSVQELREKLGI
jgi:antitoxin YefM